MLKVKDKKILHSSLEKHWQEIVLGVCILLYILYFSIYTIARYRSLYANYFDLGIMHQTVYNTFRAIQTFDFSRFLELTNPHGVDQIKRMAIHNDPFLAFFALFYFIYASPETLLIIQSIALGIGAVFVYQIGNIVLKKLLNKKTVSLIFAIAYLMYAPLQKMNQFDIHAVAFATPLLLAMFFFFLRKKYICMMVCAFLAILTKEQVGLTVSFFGFFLFIATMKEKKKERFTNWWSALFLLSGFLWFIISMIWIIPHYRQSLHFALPYFQEYGDSTTKILLGMITKPILVFQAVFRKESLDYLVLLLSPLGFFSLLSPFYLCIAFPELMMNLISKNESMRTIYFQYSAVLIPFIFISSLYGYVQLQTFFKQKKWIQYGGMLLIVLCTFWTSYLHSPLFYSQTREINSFILPAKESAEAFVWKDKLANETIKIMASGNIAPVLASRRYVYNFSSAYDLADYVVLSVSNVYNGYGYQTSIPAYEALKKDSRFQLIYQKELFEVYKKITKL